MAKKPVKRTTGVCPKCKKVVPCSQSLNVPISTVIVFFITNYYIDNDTAWVVAIITYVVLALCYGYKCDYCGSRVKKVR